MKLGDVQNTLVALAEIGCITALVILGRIPGEAALGLLAALAGHTAATARLGTSSNSNSST